MAIGSADRKQLRSLAERVAEIADQPIMAERREMWTRHNRLERVRPMVLVFPEGAWRELLPESALSCEADEARSMEATLRRRIFYHDHLHDDTVVEKEWIVHKVVRTSDWGLVPKRVPTHMETGAWGFDPVIKTGADLEKLTFPEVQYDSEATTEALEAAQDLFGDILDVRLKGVDRVSFHLMALYTQLRGLDQVMIDMLDNPGMLHDAMAILEEGNRKLVDQYIALNLLDVNNDSTYHSSGGVGYSDELPPDDFDPERVRPRDMWASAEAQEMAQVSPEMHDRFSLQYEKRLLEPFGLTGYGCCEDLTRKLDDVLEIPGIRRISIAPWADVETCAEKLDGKAIFSWKPNPAVLVGRFDSDLVRDTIQHTLEVSRNCVIEMILKDTHTCEFRPERFTKWTAIARELAERY
ncbi:MAG: hypothetical protein QGI83_13555 [Candidatus Latescibacteria bacterium]|jgi:hypothetical protein|nr:hypothetical protein [Candidatus Latescibacterota bacterium]